MLYAIFLLCSLFTHICADEIRPDPQPVTITNPDGSVQTLTFVGLGYNCEIPWEMNGFLIYRKDFIFDWTLVPYNTLISELSLLYWGYQPYLQRVLNGTGITYLHFDLTTEEYQKVFERRYYRLTNALIDPDNHLVFIRKEYPNLSREKMVQLAALLRQLMPSGKQFTLHIINCHEDQSLPFLHIETINEIPNCTLQWNSMPSTLEGRGHPISWKEFLGYYHYIDPNNLPPVFFIGDTAPYNW